MQGGQPEGVESALMAGSPVETFSALIRAGRESGTKRVVGAATVRRLVLYYSAVGSLA